MGTRLTQMITTVTVAVVYKYIVLFQNTLKLPHCFWIFVPETTAW